MCGNFEGYIFISKKARRNDQETIFISGISRGFPLRQTLFLLSSAYHAVLWSTNEQAAALGVPFLLFFPTDNGLKLAIQGSVFLLFLLVLLVLLIDVAANFPTRVQQLE